LPVDVAAKVLMDNLCYLVCQAASEQADLPSRQRVCNLANAAPLLQRMLACMMLGLRCIFALLDKAIDLLGANRPRRVPGRSRPRPARPVKPHPDLAYRGER